jgi:two-component system, NtrC family, C4-dicarboxylate transport sensor histidine kinase DctB
MSDRRNWPGDRGAEHRERLSALGTLAAETAHEFNNVLTYLSHNLEHLIDRVSREQIPGQLEELLEMRDGVNQLADLARALRDFSSFRTRPAVVDVTEVLDAAVRMVRARLQRTARLERHYEQAFQVRAIEPELRHVLLNLLLNAIEAFDTEDSRRNWIRLKVEGEAGQVTAITIQNNGPPIPPDQLERIFEPFYTTKDFGTGIGLALCRRVIDDSGGRITVQSDAESTSFVIRLPAEC